MKTIFVENGMPIIEDHAATLLLRWVNVRVSAGERLYSDLELIQLIGYRILDGDYEVTLHPKQIDMTFVVSFPATEARDSPQQQISDVYNLVKRYEEDIMAGRVTIDHDLLFGARLPAPIY